ncbi:MAG TPA: EboA domain-containing protein, partial [Burkholderiales bacterium]|nr:EboA domain-containing protein [Burkholderiales bacterium]
ALEPQVGEGLRSNVRAVFEAIAHRNPYPQAWFDTHRWNHMVLKALFIGSPLAPIQGLDARANAELARIMRDFAHERWAAGRPVPFEIWRCVGPFAEGPALEDLARVLRKGEAIEKRAAALALAASPDREAARLLQTVPGLAGDISLKRLSWATLQ